MNDLALWFGIGMLAGIGLVWGLDAGHAILRAYYDASDELD